MPSLQPNEQDHKLIDEYVKQLYIVEYLQVDKTVLGKTMLGPMMDQLNEILERLRKNDIEVTREQPGHYLCQVRGYTMKWLDRGERLRGQVEEILKRNMREISGSK